MHSERCEEDGGYDESHNGKLDRQRDWPTSVYDGNCPSVIGGSCRGGASLPTIGVRDNLRWQPPT